MTINQLRCIKEAGHSGRHQRPQKHQCHWPTCTAEVPPKLWGCKEHWFKLPKSLRDRMWKTYRPGQEITKTPSKAYMVMALEVQDWCIVNPDRTEA